MSGPSAGDLFRRACRQVPRLATLFEIDPAAVERWEDLGDHLARHDIATKLLQDGVTLSAGQRMLCLVLLAKADFGGVAAELQPNPWGPGGFWAMDDRNGPLALAIIADGVWSSEGGR